MQNRGSYSWIRLLALAFFFSIGSSLGVAQTYTISTIAGGNAPATPVTGTSIGFGGINGVAADGSGNVYISASTRSDNFDSVLNCIFKLDASGNLTPYAGTCRPGYSGDGGLAVDAQLNNPRGMAVDSAGNLYIADAGNNVVREVSTNGTISTVAGNGTAAFCGDGGPAANACLNKPFGVTVDSSGNLYIADTYNCRVRVVNTGQVISTAAGSAFCGFAGDGGIATSSFLSFPRDVLVSGGNMLIADYANSRVRSVSSTGIITTVAGNGTSGNQGDGGPAASAEFLFPSGLAADPSGNLYIADTVRVRVVSPNGIVTAFAGTGLPTPGDSGDGGPAVSANIDDPVSIAFDSQDRLLIGENFELGAVRRVGPDGTIATIAGGVPLFSGDGGPASDAIFNDTRAIASDASGNIYLSDFGNHRIRKISAGTINTVAGSGAAPPSGLGGFTYGEAATSALIGEVDGITTDSAGDLWFSSECQVLRVQGPILLIAAGIASCGYSGDGGPALSAAIGPGGIALAPNGNLFIADGGSHIRLVNLDGVISTFLTTGPQLKQVAVDPAGDVFYLGANSGSYIEELMANPGTGNYLSLGASLVPDFAVDAQGTIYFTDPNGHRIMKYTGAGVPVQIAGTGTAGYSGDGGPALNANLNAPYGIAVDGQGRVYFTDGNAVRTLVAPSLSISSWHLDNFISGASGQTYTLTVTNQGGGPTNGTVTVTENLPAGLALTSMTGTGWACTGAVCTRSDVLAPGSSYPVITVTVNVSASAGSQVVNSVSVSGGGALTANGTDPTSVVAEVVSVVSLNPASGSGSGANFVITYGDTVGVLGISQAYMLIGSSFSAQPANSCMFYWQRSIQNSSTANYFFLLNDAGTAWVSGNFVSNSQCTVSGMVASSSADTVTLRVGVGFTPGFAGTKNIYGYAVGSTSNSGWQNLGSWTVTNANTDPFQCSNTPNGAVTPTLRAEGSSEQVGDIVISCQGGVATPSGTALPQTNITVTFNGPITSRLLGSDGISEALLIVDEAGSGLSGPGPSSPQLACPTPLSGCSIISNGADPYDGTTGRPNIFQGVVSGNSVTFYGVPVSPPGAFGVGTPPGTSRVFRITNLRVNASSIASPSASISPVTVTVGSSNTSALPVSVPQATVAYVLRGLIVYTAAANFNSCTAGQVCQAGDLTFVENFATAFRLRSASSPQNIPGTFYSSESGFFDLAWSTTNPSISGAGYADSATRLKGTFSDVPQGAQLWVGVNPGNAVLTANEAGPLSPIAGTTLDGLAAQQLTVTNGTATAVWEVTTVNAAAIDSVTIPVFVVFPNGSTPSGTLSFQGSFAPNPDNEAFNAAAGAIAQNSTFPIPRFASASTDGPVSVKLLYDGDGAPATSTTFSLQYHDQAGAADLTDVYLWIEPTLTVGNSASSCLIDYQPASGNILLNSDQGTDWTGVALGVPGSLGNSQCSVNVDEGSAVVNGDDLTLTLPMTFTAAYGAEQNVYMYATGSAGNSGWQLTGTYPYVLSYSNRLNVGSSHTGSFVQGQTGTYTITVMNEIQFGTTTGAVTVSETLPAGLTLASMSGSGWTCNGNTCTRSDQLLAGSSYPPITVTVNVAANAGSPLLNMVSVSGGGLASAYATDSTAVTGSGSVSFVAGAITSPNPGSTLSGSTVTFAWSGAMGAGNGYWLRVGTTGAASYDVSDLEYTGTSATVSGIPTNGGTVYVTLYSLNPASNTWVPASYTYTAALGSGSSFAAAAITSPSQGSTLSGSTVTFMWNAGTGAGNGHWLRVGTTGVGSYDISDLEYAGTSATVSGLPTNGGTVYVALYSLNPATSAWVPANYTYTAAASGSGSASSFVASSIMSPSQGSTLSGSTVTFTWNAGTGTGNGHWLRVGTTGAASYDISDLEYSGTSATVSGIPTNGGTVYVQLYSLNPASNTWVPVSYTYTAAASFSSFVASSITSPSQGSTLSGSTVTFTWNAGTGAGNGHWLRVGTTGAGSYDVSDVEYAGTSATVSGIPTNGGTVNVTLYSLNPASNTWVPASYTYTAGLGSGSSFVAAAITSPSQGSTLSGSTVTFTWSAATGAGNGYWLRVGTTGSGSYDISDVEYSGTSATVSGIPTNGGTVYVALYSLNPASNTWVSNNYSYTAVNSGITSSGGVFTCTTTPNGAVTPTLRAEGLTEKVGDIVITCTGGTPPTAGTVLPTTDLAIYFNAAITSMLTGSGGTSEALLLVDEPGAGLSFSPTTQLACTSPTLGANPGGCPITANGGNPYDGSPGHPNIFTGVVTGNVVAFYGVPVAQPGNSYLTFRITNIRANASVFSGVTPPLNVVASISAGGLPLISTGSTLTVGFIYPGLYFPTGTSSTVQASLSGCAAGQLCQVAQLTYQENFSTAFLTRMQNAVQNIPGAVYASESGFFDPNWSTTNPSLAAVGQASFGTRLKAEFSNIPVGAQVWVTVNPLSGSSGSSAVLASSETEALAPVSPGNQANGAAQLQVTNLAATAIWEVTAESPAAIDTLVFGVYVILPAQSTQSLNILQSLAPNPDDGAFMASEGAMAQPSTFPIPRFVSPAGSNE